MRETCSPATMYSSLRLMTRIHYTVIDVKCVGAAINHSNRSHFTEHNSPA